MKCGLKTFPLSVDLDDGVKLVEAEFGLKGYAVVIKLYQAIYSRGYYMKWDIDTQLLFMRDYCLVEVGRSLLSEIVACCVRRGVFESTLFEKYQILTSKRIQETFLTATKRSTKVIFEKEYALPIVYTFIENADKNGKTVNIFFKNATDCMQFQTKERKGKESKESKKVSKEEIYIKSSSVAEPPLREDGTYDFEEWDKRRSHASIMDEMHVDGMYREKLEAFLRYCAAHGHFIMNDVLIDIICRLNEFYEDDETGKIKSLERAINGGYYDVKEGRD